MVELTEITPCAGLLPLNIGTVTLEEMSPGRLSLLAPFGDAAGMAGALEKAHGLGWPEPGRSTGKDEARCLWFGRGEALLMGPTPDAALAGQGAVVDQSDGWAVVALDGPGSVDTLAHLVPLDLRAGVFGQGHTARSQLAHMNASITRLGPERFMIMVYRSMAGTMVHELKAAMAAVAARV